MSMVSDPEERRLARLPESELTPELLERVLVGGDLERLSARERLDWLQAVCRSLNLNPLTSPIQFIKLSGRLVPYVTRNGTDQLRKNHSVSVMRLEHLDTGDSYRCTCYVRDASGREDSDVGEVWTKGLVGDNLVNARLKSITKSKRRATLSICGLGWLDETEVETIPQAQRVVVDSATGEFLEPPPAIAPPARPRKSDAEILQVVAMEVIELQEFGIDSIYPPAEATREEILALGRRQHQQLVAAKKEADSLRLTPAGYADYQRKKREYEGEALPLESEQADPFADNGT